MKRKIVLYTISLLITFSGIATGCKGIGNNTLINVSYDPTRELYTEYNEAFSKHWKEKTGEIVEVVQSHGGSGKQALEVANGLPADVVTLALEGDIDSIVNAGLIEDGFVDEFDGDSAPYTSTIVFLVRKDNPKNINDWDDLLRDDVGVITPNPKTSGGARWNYLAAWYYFERQGLSEEQVKEKVKKLYDNVVVLDSGARGATTSFVENGQGDVLIAWENEAFLSLEEKEDEYEIVIPSASILCQPTVAIVDDVVYEHDSEELAKEYLNYLYSDEAQNIIARNYYRPVNAEVEKAYTADLRDNVIRSIPSDGKWLVDNIDLTNIDYFGGWDKATEKFFAEGALFDEIYD